MFESLRNALKCLLLVGAAYLVFHLLHFNDPAGFILALTIVLLSATLWGGEEQERKPLRHQTTSLWAQKIECAELVEFTPTHRRLPH